jgi:hypothetical protein
MYYTLDCQGILIPHEWPDENERRTRRVAHDMQLLGFEPPPTSVPVDSPEIAAANDTGMTPTSG